MILSLGMAIPLKISSLTERKRAIGPQITLSFANKNLIRVDIEQLRHQINQLHAQAEITRSKAKNARLRLMRLSEASENLQRRAVMEVARNRENEARELLLQKKKLLQALERTKRRVDLLDELSKKTNEAISLKETQLIGNFTLLSEIKKEDAAQEIHIISPKNIIDNDAKKTDIYDLNHTNRCDEEDTEAVKYETSVPLDQLNYEEVKDSFLNDFGAISSYKDFLAHIDGQLRQAELDTCNFLRLSTMILESKQRQMNPKVQQISDILDHMRSIREKIASLLNKTENDN